MASNKKAYVYADPEGVLRVYPPVVVLEKDANNPPSNDTLTIVNLTNDEVVLAVPKGALKEPQGGADVVAKLIGKGNGNNTATLATKDNGAYAYSVLEPKSGKKAKGNSDPVIIIDT